MDEMRNITLHHLEKYEDSTSYAEVAYGIFKNLNRLFQYRGFISGISGQ